MGDEDEVRAAPSFLVPNDKFYLCGTTKNNFNQNILKEHVRYLKNNIKNVWNYMVFSLLTRLTVHF